MPSVSVASFAGCLLIREENAAFRRAGLCGVDGEAVRGCDFRIEVQLARVNCASKFMLEGREIVLKCIEHLRDRTFDFQDGTKSKSNHNSKTKREVLRLRIRTTNES